MLTLSKLSPFIKNILYFITALFSLKQYIVLSKYWIEIGGYKSNLVFFELPIIITLLLLFYFPLKHFSKTIIFSVVPIVGLYILYDFFYHFLARIPRLSDFENLNTLATFSPSYLLGVSMLIIIVITILAYSIYQFHILHSKKVFYWTLFLKIILGGAVFMFFNTQMFTTLLNKKFTYYSYSEKKTIKKNGRLTSFIYYKTISQHARKQLILYKDKEIAINKILFNTLLLSEKKNIYILILESFVDPRLIKNATYNNSPLHPNMKKYLLNNEFSYVISPTYGGLTAKAEFEILTGVPSLALVSSVDFNTLEGRPISGYINLLQQNQYNTYATVATDSGFFNAKEAYKSIGFDTVSFLEEESEFLRNDEDKIIFDGDLFQYNILKVQQNQLKEPFINYLLGIYGHNPFHRNTVARPNVIKVTHTAETKLTKIANQFYYRTKALSEYLDSILKIDPKSIIYVSSDHLPPILNKNLQYKKNKYINIAILLVDGKNIDINQASYFDIPRIIWNKQNRIKDKPKLIKDQIYQNVYLKSLSESIFNVKK